MQGRFRLISVAVALATALMAVSAGSALAATEAKTLSATDLTPHGAVLQGEVSLNEQSALAGFEYGETAAYGSDVEAPQIPKKTGWGSASAPVSGLEPGTTYHYRFVAWVGNGYIYGQDKTFTTAQPIFTSPAYPASLSVKDPGDPLVVGVENGNLTCDVDLEGTMTAAGESISMTPSFSGCLLVGVSASVSANGCSYVFHAGGGTSGTLDIACPEGKAITVSAGNCAMAIPAQTGLSAVALGYTKTVAEGFIVGYTFDLGIDGLKYEKTKDGLLCGFNGTGVKEDGSFTGTARVYASIANIPLKVGFAPTTTFQADQYPATLSAQQAAGAPVSVGVEGGSLTCSSVTASGALASGADTTLALAPAASGCELFGGGATLSFNGCGYEFHAGTGTSSTMDIVCPAGKSITVEAGSCAMSIPAQAGLSAVNASNDTGSSPKKLKLAHSVNGLQYTKTKDGLLCKFSGTGSKTDGTYGGTFSVSATDAGGKAIGVGVGS